MVEYGTNFGTTFEVLSLSITGWRGGPHDLGKNELPKVGCDKIRLAEMVTTFVLVLTLGNQKSFTQSGWSLVI